MPREVYKYPPQCGFQKGHHSKTEFKKGHYPVAGFKKRNKFGFKKGYHPTNGFKKGHIPWNKDKKMLQFSGKNNSNWQGGKTIDKNGYILIYKSEHPFKNNRNYVFEHRLIMEKQIGRYLLPEEASHHLGKKFDNRPQMLMAFTSNSAHKRFEGNPNNVKPSEIIFDGRKI